MNIVADQAEITIDTSVDQNDTVLTANASGPTISYQWIDCNNGDSPISGATNQSFTADENGDYAVIITDSRCGVSDTSICYSINTLSIEDNSSLELKLYPNPIEDVLNIELGNSYDKVDVKIYSLTGQMVKSTQLNNGLNFKINLSELSSGLYILKIDSEGKTHTSRILKN